MLPGVAAKTADRPAEAERSPAGDSLDDRYAPGVPSILKVSVARSAHSRTATGLGDDDSHL
jgi:hypothetical protein